MRALIIGGGIGGLAAAVALRRVGVEPVVFEKAPRISEVGAGVSLWSNAMIALRRLGIEAAAIAAGSVFERTQSLTWDGRPLDQFDFAALGRAAGAPSICIHRAALQRLLLEAACAGDPAVVRTGRECVGFGVEADGVAARFDDGSHERGDVLIGADGIHSVVRARLFGEEKLRFAGYLAWRGVAHGVGGRLAAGSVSVILAPGSHAGCFPCGADDVYWFVTRNGEPGTHAGAAGNRAEVLAHVKEWRAPFRAFVEATEEAAVLRNDVVDRPPRQIWGDGRVTLLGDAIHATTPNLGQGACQALEDAVVLADALRKAAEPQAGLRDYEARRRERANFVIAQSWRMGVSVQLANPVASWLRDRLIASLPGRKLSHRLFSRLLLVDLPELSG